MSISVAMWMEEIIVGSVALVALGISLAGVRSSAWTRPEQSIGGRWASLLATIGVVLFWWPRWSSRFGIFMEGPDWQYAIPMVLSTIAVLAFIATDLRRSSALPLGEVDLTPRSLWSFGPRSWFIGWWTLNVLLVGTVLIAGPASRPDEAGAFKFLELNLGSATAGTLFFGWAYGVPVLIALSLLVAATHIALWRIARPPVSTDPVRQAQDRAGRRNQVRLVLTVAAGATAFALGQCWLFIGRSAQLMGGVHGADGVTVETGTPFAALAVPLTVLGFLLAGLGLALVLLGVCQPRRKNARSTSSRATEALAELSRR